MPPAARMADPTTHGSPLAPGPGSVNVMIGFMPAWRATIDQHACPAVSITGPDGVGSVMMGSPTVFINGMMACRMGDIVIEKPGLALGPANPIIMGCPTVMIGEVGMGAVIAPSAPVVGGGMVAVSAAIPGPPGAAAQSLAKASQHGSATVPVSDNPALHQAAGGSSKG
ncbi:MAG: PAAR domain-containing protein [Janthinobacterium lividum]